MTQQMNSLFGVIGNLGAYFAIMMVLSLAVEVILDAIKLNPWINSMVDQNNWLSFLDIRKRRISPDQAMRDVAYWVPHKSQAEVQVAALNNLANSFGFLLNEATDLAEVGTAATRDLIALTGMTRQAAETRQAVANKLYLIRQAYNEGENARIARLRRVSGAIGVVIALLMQMNTFTFLAPLISAEMNAWLTNGPAQFLGMVLTGIAASTGSAFWHDQLDRLRAVKDSARTIHTIVERTS